MMSAAGQTHVTVRAPESPRHATELKVSSKTFDAGGLIPRRMAYGGCGGENVSPELSWSGAPTGTKSYVITCFDPDAPTGSGFWHWGVANIPAEVSSVPENAVVRGLPAGSVQTLTDYGESHWGGPCPPAGDAPHRYVFTVYALDTARSEGVSHSTAGARLIFSMRGHLLAKGSIEGRYGR